MTAALVGPVPLKRCAKCKAVKPLADFSANRRTGDGRQPYCRPCWADYMRAYYQASSPVAKAAVCERVRKTHQSLRKVVFDHYGWACTCCGTSDDPTIDHVNGDGMEHREQLFKGKRGGHGSQFYRWLIKNEFPEGFQTLCKPCNSSKKASSHCKLNHETVNAA